MVSTQCKSSLIDNPPLTMEGLKPRCTDLGSDEPSLGPFSPRPVHHPDAGLSVKFWLSNESLKS
jgi:hypothetical protein